MGVFLFLPVGGAHLDSKEEGWHGEVRTYALLFESQQTAAPRFWCPSCLLDWRAQIESAHRI